jgi:hypothetical protein
MQFFFVYALASAPIYIFLAGARSFGRKETGDGDLDS